MATTSFDVEEKRNNKQPACKQHYRPTHYSENKYIVIADKIEENSISSLERGIQNIGKAMKISSQICEEDLKS